MRERLLKEKEIISGFRRGDADVIRRYFYGYLEVGYNIFNQRYQLSEKQNLDFFSLAHQYALYLMEHDWAPLEDHSPEVSLKTWLINGFRFVVLDALKWYRKEYGSISFVDYLCSFDAANNLRLQFNRMVEDVCEHANMSLQDRQLTRLLLIDGYKGKEVAEMMGVSPAAISQRYARLMGDVIGPYFRKNFDLELDMEERMDVLPVCYSAGDMCMDYSAPAEEMFSSERFTRKEKRAVFMSQKRTTPEFITELQPDEVFVFGSNLKGMHGGGAALVAYRKFGAVWGQGVGLQGQSYGIPTMQGGVETIRPYVDEFIGFAEAHPELTFLVTRIGCGIAGFSEDEIAPLFRKARGMENVVLPEGW